MAEDVQFGSFTNRHNFNFGDTQVSQIDFGNTRVWVNEVSVSIIFDNQVAGTTIAGTFSIPPGVPGASFSENFTWTTDDQTLDRFTASNCSLSDDGGGLITCTVTGATSGTNRRTRNINISGTYPDNDLTSTATFTGTIITLTGSTTYSLTAAGISTSGAVFNSNIPAPWSFSFSITTDGFDEGDSQAGIDSPTIYRTGGALGSTSASTSSATASFPSLVCYWNGGNGSVARVQASVSTPETATRVGGSGSFCHSFEPDFPC